jgi:prepilin-type N-terminal cleavage/methylation domain-containing protein
MRPLSRLKARLNGDEGFTLLELVTTVSLLGVVVAALLVTMNGAQKNLDREISRTSSNDQVRQAIENLDRELRSGDVLYDPNNDVYSPGDVVAGDSLRIYTESNLPTRGAKMCVQWRISSSGLLQRRMWDPTNPPTTLGFATVANGIVNRSESPAVKAFSLSGLNLINVTFDVQDSATKGSPVRIQSSITGRDTTQSPAIAPPCGPTPPAPVTGPNGLPQYG